MAKNIFSHLALVVSRCANGLLFIYPGFETFSKQFYFPVEYSGGEWDLFVVLASLKNVFKKVNSNVLFFS